MQAIESVLFPIVSKINEYLSNYILVFLLIGVGLWYSIKTRFVQVRCFGEGMRKVFGNLKLKGDKHDSGMSSFQALATAIAAQVGTGNIVGASGAILTGGPGAIFWMWVIAFFGMATIYAEATLAQKTRIVDPDGTWRMTAAAQNNTYFTSETLITSGTAVPGLSSDAFQRRYSDSTVRYISEQLDVVNASAQRPFPYYSLTKAQQEEIAPLQAAIGRLVDESIARWVLGEVEITDASFAQFGQDLNDAGLPAFMAFWQKILDGGNSK